MTAGFLVLYFLTSGFIQKWYIPKGVPGAVGRVFVTDYDRDNNHEVVFTCYSGTYGLFFCELHLPNTWEIDSFPYISYPILMDMGDFDLDGLPNLVLQEDFGDFPNGPPIPGISIAESSDSFSYPTQEVWRDTVDIGTVQPICAYDIDRDSIPEIVQTAGEPGQNYYIDFSIYESAGNNIYSVIYQFETPETPTSTIAFGDFDRDSLNEFVMGTIDGQYSIFESPMNDSYVPLFVNVQLPTANIKDCFSVPDADGDGRLEFVVKGFTVPDAKIHCFIFEAAGNNTYQIIKSFTFSGGYDWYGGGYSEAGDVDGDSIPEIVLEGCQNVHIIKSAGNDSFYLWNTLPGNLTGSSVRVTNDIDGNGYNEIVISGNNQTRIYEYDPGGIEETAIRFTPYALRLEVYPNPFTTQTTIRFMIHDSRYTMSDVGQGFSLAKSKSEGLPYIHIYDATGRVVKQFNHLTNSPFNQIVWQGDDALGREVSNGVYFIHLETCDRKILMKQKVIKLE